MLMLRRAAKASPTIRRRFILTYANLFSLAQWANDPIASIYVFSLYKT